VKSLVTTQRLAVVLLLALGIAFFYATYKAIDNIVAEQSRVQQQAVSPVFKLVRDELLRPLYIAETFANSIDFTTPMDSRTFDEAALLRRLQIMEQNLGLKFFVASEVTRKQYFSDGTMLDLVEGEVAWYFEAKARNRDVMADLGQVGDVHLFFDVKMHGPNGEFLGYVGVGKRVQRFLDTFDRYKSSYDYEFLFVNDNNEIILSSLPQLVVTDAYIPTLDSTTWFSSGNSSQQSNDSEIVQVDDEDFLVSEFGIEELGWRLLLLVPLEARQAQVSKSFVTNALAAVFIVILLASTLLFMLLLYKHSIERKTEIDALTGLPNRSHLQRRFRQLQRSGDHVCAVVIDLDHFKHINDSHGHDAGDRVLAAAANVLKQDLREQDTVCRWGGEEFVMLIPAKSIELGRAIAERARANLETLEISSGDACLSVTASFGVAFGAARDESLAELLAKADKVLYEAKQKGRNQVKLYLAA
jgi:diguanylate cyclase (GGDEF)-like protein